MLRAIVIDDEPLIVMMLESMLTDMGFSVAAHAHRLSDGMAAALSGHYDVALIDCYLGDELCWPVADLLANGGTKVILTSGTPLVERPPQHESHPMLNKPFVDADLKLALDLLSVVPEPKPTPAPMPTP